MAELRELLAVDPESLGDRLGELGDAVEVVAQVGVALGQRVQQHVGALAPGARAAGVLLRVHRVVGLAHRFGRRRARRAGSTTVPNAVEIVEALAALCERARTAACSTASRREASAMTQNSSPPGR